MIIAVFATIIGCVMFGVSYKNYVRNKKIYLPYIDNKKFTKFDFSLYIKLLYVIFILLGIVSAVYGFLYNSFETSAMGIVIALMFTGEFLNVQYKYVMYYSEDGFFTKGQFVRYKSIRDFEGIKHLSWAWIRVVTLNGEKITVSPKCYKLIRDKRNSLRK